MGGSSNNSQKAAQAAEAERQAAIKQAQAGIESAFNNPERQGEYVNFYNATRTLGMEDLDKQKALADRNSKFAMARSGLTGGSRSIDVGRALGEDYTKGLLTVDQRALAAKSDLFNADQQAKNNLLGLAAGGLDLTTATANAAASLRNNLEAGQSTRLAGGLGDLFGGIADVNKRSEESRIRNQAQTAYGNSMYSPFFSWGQQ